MTLIQAILSWVNPLAPVMPVLRTLTDPLLEPIRRILPSFSGFDFSPLALLILAQIALMMLNRISFTLVGL
jgi:YggT family protein